MAGRGSWIECTVDDIKGKVQSALATGPFGSAISSRFFQDSGIPVIRGSNLSQDVGHRLVEDGLAFVSETKAREFSRSVARRGDLVFTCWGTIDQVGLIDGRCSYLEYIVSNKQMKLTPDPAKADSLFLYYMFSSPAMKTTILNYGIGSSVPGFNLGQLRSIPFLLPPLAEQRAIAYILGTLDDMIELNRRMNETLEAIARVFFQSWFVDFDPVRAKLDGRQPEGMDKATADLFPDSFEDSPLGKIPKGWRTSPLPEVVQVNPQRSLRRGELAPYLDMKNMPTQGHRPTGWFDRPMASGTKFINGDTLLARITPCLENGKTAFVDFLRQGQVGWGSTEFIVLRPKPPLPTEYAYFLARGEELRTHAIQNMTGSSGRQRVPVECLAQFPLVVPTTGIAKRFGDAVGPLLARAKANSEQNANLAALRDTLLPKLLSGEIRVPDAEKLMESKL